MHILNRIRYSDINLQSMTGTIVHKGSTPLGGDCLVHWDDGCLLFGGLVTEECAANLEVVGVLRYHAFNYLKYANYLRPSPPTYHSS
jgi:hypothetical protein